MQSTFDSAALLYQNTLEHSNYDHVIIMSRRDIRKSAGNNSISLPSRRRHWNIIWFNPPFSKTVRTNVAQTFLQLMGTMSKLVTHAWTL
jgi:tRNA1(Val) A37 N6-methylase TrmN6